MKKRLVITTEEMHRVIVQFLLDEIRSQMFLAHRQPTIEDRLISALIEENKKYLPEDLLNVVNNSTWWRRIKVAIEDCGLNHFALLQAVKNPSAYEDYIEQKLLTQKQKLS